MIGYIEGEVIATDERGVVMLTQSGVGYKVLLPSLESTATLGVGANAAFWTYLAVRDDALDLWGFPTQAELKMFQALLTVSGIGPKSAVGTLGAAGVEALVRAIKTQDPSYLVKIGGLGKKTAEKIVMELKDKHALLPDLSKTGEDDVPVATAESEALDALEALGYAVRDVREIVQKIAREEDEARTIIRRVLQEMGKR